MGEEKKNNSRNQRRNVNEEAQVPNSAERTILLLEYLKKNTDRNHPVKSIGEIRDAFNEKNINIGNNKTVNTLIKRLANVLNADSGEHMLPESQWRIVFDEYRRRYGEPSEEELWEEETDAESNNGTDGDADTDSMRIENLYYASALSNEEVDALIEAVLFSRTLTTQEADKLIHALEEGFTSRHYRRRAGGICKIHEKVCYDRELLRKNLLVIQQAIEENVQIEYRLNSYSHDKRLVPLRDYKTTVSPYYIVADNGRYYLLAAHKKYMDTMIVRIDLMTEVRIAERDEETGKKGMERLPVREIKNMPQNWNDDFPLKHLHMSYDPPVKIKLRVKGGQAGSYLFLHDHFGDAYRYRGPDRQAPDHDIVEVECSAFGMMNLAVQFADELEVLEPAGVRDMVREKVRILREKYQ